MLTQTQYQELWQKWFANHVGGNEMPSYEDFSMAEEWMFQDYQDIFRGRNTRAERGVPDGAHVIHPWYRHPYFNEHGPLVQPSPCIRYILVAEARHPTNNTYFYNKRHTDDTPYFSAPRDAWQCPPNQYKKDILMCLASKGVLLLDLFCFALPYTTQIRHNLNTNGATRSFWDDMANPYSIQNRIHAIQDLLCDNWDLALVAPCVISKHIKDAVFPPIAATPLGIHPAVFNDLHINPNRCADGTNWKKIAVGQQAPGTTLIQNAFD